MLITVIANGAYQLAQKEPPAPALLGGIILEDCWGLMGPAAGRHVGQGQLPARRQGDCSACLTKGIHLLFLSS